MEKSTAQIVHRCLISEVCVNALQEVDYRVRGLRILVERCVSLDIPREHYEELKREYLEANAEKQLVFNALLAENLPAQYLDEHQYMAQVYYTTCEIVVTERSCANA